MKQDLASILDSFARLKGNPIKKLLKASLDLFEARHTGVLYGTNQTRIKCLPTSTWDRGIMDEIYGRGIKGLFFRQFGAQMVTLKKLSPVFFYRTGPGGQLKPADGIIAYILRHCADYYEKGINVIICPDTRKMVDLEGVPYYATPFYVYNGHTIKKSDQRIYADTRIVRQFNSANSIYIYLPDYGILVINTALPSLVEQKNGLFVRQTELMDRLAILSKMVDDASLENLGLLRGKKGAQLLWRKEKHLRALSRELIENENNFRDLYQTAPVAYISMDTRGRILNFNQRARALSGYGKADLIGRNVDEFLFKTRDETGSVSEIRKALMRGEPVSEKTLQMKPFEGEPIWISLSVDTVRDLNGNVVEFRAMVMDITERKAIEKQLFHAQKMEAIGQLSGGIAHDFNNVLSPITGYVDAMLIKVDASDPLYSQLRTIQACVNHARELVSQMLTFGRQTDTVLKPLNIFHAVNESMLLVRSSLPATIQIDLCLEESDALIMADSVQIHQMIMNLVTHAYQSIQGTRGVLRIQLSKGSVAKKQFSPFTGKQKELICLTVVDNGIPMDAETCDRLFDPYFSVDRQNKTTGIGLSVVHGIVSAHGGWISVQSSAESGNRFDIFFPVYARDSAHGGDSPALERSEDVRFGQEHILLVDDEKAVADTLVFMLEKMGYTVDCFYDPLEALAFVKENAGKIDLVITDLSMTGLDGLEFAGHLQQLRPDLPVILCSGNEDIQWQKKIDQGRVQGWLKKPVSVPAASRELKRLLDHPA